MSEEEQERMEAEALGFDMSHEDGDHHSKHGKKKVRGRDRRGGRKSEAMRVMSMVIISDDESEN